MEQTISGSAHNYTETHFKRPTWCDQCGKYFASPVGKQGLKCSSCKRTCHRSCLQNALSHPCGEEVQASKTIRIEFNEELVPDAFLKCLDPVRQTFLQHDVLFTIFALLPCKNLPTVLRVCKRFYQIGMNPILWKQLHLEENALWVTIDRLPLERFTHVEDLSLQSCVSLREEGIAKVLNTTKKIVSLNLSYCADYITPELIKQNFNQLDNLTSLNLSHTSAANASSLKAFASSLPSTLKTLTMISFDPINSELLQDAFQNLSQQCVNLETLDLAPEESMLTTYSMGFGDNRVRATVLTSLGKLVKLVNLRLPDIIFVGFWQVKELSTLTNLRKFHIPARGAEGCPPLPALGWNLDDLHINDVNEEILTYLETCVLRSLRIEKFARGVKMPQIVRALEALSPHLESLFLNTYIIGGGVNDLVKVIRTMPSLKQLLLHTASLTDDDFAELMIPSLECLIIPPIPAVSGPVFLSPQTLQKVATLPALKMFYMDFDLKTHVEGKRYGKDLNPYPFIFPEGVVYPHLTEFAISGETDNPESYRRLSTACPQVKTFRLGSKAPWDQIMAGKPFEFLEKVELGDVSGTVLKLVAEKCPNLRSLAFGSNFISNEPESVSLKDFTSSLQQLPKLIELRICVGLGPKFDDDHCAVIGRHCPHLRELRIYTRGMGLVEIKVRVTDKGIADIVKGCPLLLVLYFEKFQVKDVEAAPHTILAGWVPGGTKKTKFNLRRSHTQSMPMHGGCSIQ